MTKKVFKRLNPMMGHKDDVSQTQWLENLNLVSNIFPKHSL